MDNFAAYLLKDKNVLLTGATGYLGRHMALGLAELGATVIVNGRSREHVEALVAEISEGNFKAIPAIFDINDECAVREWFEHYGKAPLHGLINNAYRGVSGSIETADSDDYRNSYEVALVAAHQLVKCALTSLRCAVEETGSASIVNIASMYGMVSPDQRIYADKKSANPPFYGAAKAALLQWTRYAACEFGPEGIRVNSLSPGAFPSESVHRLNPDLIGALEKKVPMGRVGQPDELRGPLSFLISSASSYVNGANIVVDGGWTCW